MMAAGSDIEQDVVSGFVKHWCDYGDVRQVRTSVVRRIQHKNISRHYSPAALLSDGFHAFTHRTQMHRDVGRICNETAIRGKYCARKVKPFLDVDGIRGVLEYHSHLLGDRHEKIVKYLEHHGICLGADRGLGCARLYSAQHQLVAAIDLGAPTRLKHGGCDGLLDNGGADDVATR